jgi:hypothetical protein
MKKDKTKLPVMVDWRASADGSKIVFFEVDGEDLFEMDAERFGLLTNGEHVRGILTEAAQERLFPAEWGLEQFVGVQRLLQKCLSLEMIAKLWGAPGPAVRSFYSAAMQKFQHATDLVRQEWARQGSSETEKDYCTSRRPADVRMSEDPRAGEDFLEVPRMAAILKEKGPGGAAEDMALKVADLEVWIERNKRYLALFGYKDNLF